MKVWVVIGSMAFEGGDFNSLEVFRKEEKASDYKEALLKRGYDSVNIAEKEL